jgi:uncharacterized protein YutE (UPF0331/DUF86 family)
MEILEKRIKIIEERINRLSQMSLSINSFYQYQASQDVKDIVERNLHVAIEACLDIAKIIISEKKLNEPKDYKSAFIILVEAGILSEKSLSFLIPMAGTRNILLHNYDKIDDSIIYGILKKHLKDFLIFLKEIRKKCKS